MQTMRPPGAMSSIRATMRPLRRALVPAGAAAALIAVAVAGCGDSTSKTVDTSSIEQGIEQQLATPNAKVSNVGCPSDVSAATGTTFTCSVTWSNKAEGRVKVAETSSGHYTYTTVPGSVNVPGSVVEQELSDELAKQGAANATVNCPETIVVDVGKTATCDLRSAGGQAAGTVTFTFSGDEPTIDPASVKPA